MSRQKRVGRPRTSAIGSNENGTRLADALRGAGLTASAVARQLGYSDSRTVRSWISGDSGPDKQRAAHLTYLLADASVYGWWSWPEDDAPVVPGRADGSPAERLGEQLAEQPVERTIANHDVSPHGIRHRRAGILTVVSLAALGGWVLLDQTDVGTTATPSDSTFSAPQGGADPTGASSPPQSDPPQIAGAVDMTTDGQPVPLDLSTGGALFTAPDRWVIHAEPEGGDRCTFQVGLVGADSRYLFGESLVLHGRVPGTYVITSPTYCAMEVQAEPPGGRELPLTLTPTGQSSDTVVFESPGPFTVKSSGADDCSATVFDDATGLKVEAGIGPNSYRRFMGGGSFWVTSERYGCSVTIVAST